MKKIWEWIKRIFGWAPAAVKVGVEALSDACVLLDDLAAGLPDGKNKDKARAVCRIIKDLDLKLKGGKT